MSISSISGALTFTYFTIQFLGIFKIWNGIGTPIYNTEVIKIRNQMSMVQPMNQESMCLVV